VDDPILARLAEVGIVAGARWSETTGQDPAMRDAAVAGIQAGLHEFAQRRSAAAANGVRVKPAQWGTRATLGTGYLPRAWGAFQGVFGNTVDQAACGGWYSDADGQPLNGADHDYAITLTADNLSHVGTFWSITMYSLPQPYLVPNEIDRYKIGSRSPGLIHNDDGSVTVYLQHQRPDPKHEPNWLPAPRGVPPRTAPLRPRPGDPSRRLRHASRHETLITTTPPDASPVLAPEPALGTRSRLATGQRPTSLGTARPERYTGDPACSNTHSPPSSPTWTAHNDGPIGRERRQSLQPRGDESRRRSIRHRLLAPYARRMALRPDNVGIVVEDLDPAIKFFRELGLELEG